MKGFYYKRIALMCALGSTIVMSGCSLGGGGSDTSSEKSTLKVMYYDERSFYDQFGMLYAALHPNVDFSVVSNQNTSNEPVKDPEAVFDKFIEEQQPDIIMLSPDELTKYAGEGKLVELDAMTEEKDYNKGTLIPGLLDYMKDLGEGKIYGLSPNFYSQVIFYNKDMFTKYGIALPEDHMSWDKLFELAQRFPRDGAKDKRVYGLNLGYNSDIFQLGSLIGGAQNLSMFNPKSKQVTIDTDAWKKVFQTAINGLKSGAMYKEDQNGSSNSTYEDYLLRDPFVSGKAAMTMDGAYMMNQIKEAQTRLKDKVIKNWDIVTVPIDPQNPDSSPYMSFGQIFAINSKSVNIDAAKDFIRYVTSDEFARVNAKRNNGNFPVRTKYIVDDGNHNMTAFYSLKPMQSSIYKDLDKLPQNFFNQFMGIAQEGLKGVLDGKKSIDEALALVQTKGQQALVKEIANEKNKPAEASSGTSSTKATSTTSIAK
ncbi:extracellular solute-binding protein [Paenibacillus baekrokdamisoli]|uniref:extracellular solute-binding protein n=1 Tax=Paenibacillus baekrokdamisoli TaxID=1712516 RepID=UPI00160C0F9B|nr:extracellular solute-binding protein [Paenibacillus baekrokdamisoli]